MRVEQGRSTSPKACAASPQRKHDVFENLTREAEDAIDRAALDIDQQRVRAAIDLLAVDPRPPRAIPLRGEDGVHRVRVGTYRILYSVADEIRVVSIIRIGHRRDTYR